MENNNPTTPASTAPAPVSSVTVNVPATPPTVPVTPSPADPPTNGGGSKKLLIIAGVLLVILLIAAGVYLFMQQREGAKSTAQITQLKADIGTLNGELEGIEVGDLDEELSEIDKDLSSL